MPPTLSRASIADGICLELPRFHLYFAEAKLPVVIGGCGSVSAFLLTPLRYPACEADFSTAGKPSLSALVEKPASLR